jgi:hypothetical protein
MSKEMDYIQKAGIKHPSKAGVIYSFKRAVPGIFRDSIVAQAGGASFLPVLKTALDWESILVGDANTKPGLWDILTGPDVMRPSSPSSGDIVTTRQ